MEKPALSVIIPNYNGRKLLENNLPTVFAALDNAKLTYELIVVDDCSTDESVTFISRAYPQIKLIKKDQNSGFSATCNLGVAHAQYPYVMFLNSDIQLSLTYFDGQFDYFKHPDTFGVMAKIVGARQGEVQDTARMYTFSGAKLKANTFFHVLAPTEPVPTAYLSGANAIVDTKKLRLLGGFDELFSPFYYEDFELGLRAWRLGWKCYYHSDTYCLHDHSSTTRNYKTAAWVKAIFFRNRFLMHKIHLNSYQKVLFYAQLMVQSTFMWLTGKFYFYKALGMFIGKREEATKSKNRFEALMRQHNSNRSIIDVRNEMNLMVANQQVVAGLGTT
jgi:GT2 family glycosyltransferase